MSLNDRGGAEAISPLSLHHGLQVVQLPSIALHPISDHRRGRTAIFRPEPPPSMTRRLAAEAASIPSLGHLFTQVHCKLLIDIQISDHWDWEGKSLNKIGAHLAQSPSLFRHGPGRFARQLRA